MNTTADVAEGVLVRRALSESVPLLAAGMLAGGRSAGDLEEVRSAALLLVYRILVLNLAARGVDEMRRQIGEAAGEEPALADGRIARRYRRDRYGLFRRLATSFARSEGLRLFREDPHPNPLPEYRERGRRGSRRLTPSPGTPGEGRDECLSRRPQLVPDYFLASAIDRLGRAPDPLRGGRLAPVNVAAVGVRLLGSVHERAMAMHLRRSGDVLEMVADRPERKATGSYYTPDSIVRDVVARTVGPVLEQKRASARTEDDLLDLKVLDPAMGSGYFLVEAVRFIAARVSDFLGGRAGDLRPKVLAHCIYGVDINPLAVDLAAASLWIEAGCPAPPPRALECHLAVGDALSEEVFTRMGVGAFDAVIGNPPYGPLAGRPDLAPHAYNAAAAFTHVAHTRLAKGHNLGFVVPKSITYSRGWSATLDEILPNLDALVDASEAFDGVLLEQVVIHCGPRRTSHYEGGRFTPAGLEPAGRVDKALRGVLGAAIAGATDEELALARQLLARGVPLSTLVTVQRGGPWQRLTVADRGGRRVPVIGGRAVRRFGIDESKIRYVDPSAIDPDRLAADRRPKIVAQNIVAHVTRPAPHLRIMAAYDSEGRVTLDTVNRIVPKDGAAVPYEAVLALLNSKLASWFAYRFIYNRAVRTIHFDADYAGRIPFPDAGAAALAEVRRIVEGGAEPGAVDDWVYRAFGIDRAARDLIESTTFHGDDRPPVRATSRTTSPQAAGPRPAAW